MTMKDFGAFQDIRRNKNWLIKSAPKNICLKTCPACFSRAQNVAFLLSTLNSFKGCWRSAAAVAHDLILVEVDGKHPRQVPIRG